MRGFGGPGHYLTGGNRYAALLAQQPDPNNGTATGGIASALQRALMGHMMAKDQSDRTAAQQALVQGMTAVPMPEGMQGPPKPGGIEGATMALGALKDNPYAGRLAQDLLMKQAEQQSKMANAKELAEFQAGLKPPPATVQEYEYAKANGFAGSFEDFKQLSGQRSQETFGNTPIWGTDANGNPVLMQPSNRGGVRVVNLPEGVTPQRGQTSRVDLGDRFGILDANGTLVGYIPKGLAPERKIGDDRVVTLPGVPGGAPVATQPGATPAMQPAASPGMASAAPGGVGVTDLPPTQEDERKRAERETVKNRAADVVLTDINRALTLMDQAILPTAGFGGEALSSIPGTAAHDVQSLIKTVRSNVGFDRLQQMRNASPTGGALGQVSETELGTLQAVLGNLEQSQSPEQLRYNLRRLHNLYLDIVHGPGNGPPRVDLNTGNPMGQPAQPNGGQPQGAPAIAGWSITPLGD